MTHPVILEAVASARVDDLLRAANRRRGRVVRGEEHRRRHRFAAWLGAQLHRKPVAGSLPGRPFAARITSSPTQCTVTR